MYPRLVDLCCLDNIITEQNHDEAGRSSVWSVVIPLGNVEYWQMCPRKEKKRKKSEVSKDPGVDSSNMML